MKTIYTIIALWAFWGFVLAATGSVSWVLGFYAPVFLAVALFLTRLLFDPDYVPEPDDELEVTISRKKAKP